MTFVPLPATLTIKTAQDILEAQVITPTLTEEEILDLIDQGVLEGKKRWDGKWLITGESFKEFVRSMQPNPQPPKLYLVS